MDPLILFFGAVTLLGVVGIVYGLTHRRPSHR